MDIFKCDVYRGPNIGVYCRANDERVFLPRGFAGTKAARLEEYLGAEALLTSVANTRLIGALMALNNHGLLLPSTATADELELLRRRSGLSVAVLDTRHNALGNLVCANDRGCVASPAIPACKAREIADVLDVEVVRRRVAGYGQVGAMMAATSRGGVVHPEADPADVREMSGVMGVALEPATVNGGVPFVSSGILANGRSVVVGSMTSGPEIMMLTRAFSG